MKKLLLISMLLIFLWCSTKEDTSIWTEVEEWIITDWTEVLIDNPEVAAPQDFSTSVSEGNAPSLFE